MLSKEIVVVDYHRGNLQSVVRGLSAVGGFAVASDDPKRIASAAYLRVVQARGGAAQVLYDGPGGVDRLVLLGVVADLEAVARDDLARVGACARC